MSSIFRSTRGRNLSPSLASFATVNIEKYLKDNDVAAYDLRIQCDKRAIDHNSSNDRVWLLQSLKEHDQQTLYGVLNNVDAAAGGFSAISAAERDEPMLLLNSGEPHGEKTSGKRKRENESEEGAATPATNKRSKRSQKTTLRSPKPRKGTLKAKKATKRPAYNVPQVQHSNYGADPESSKHVSGMQETSCKKRKLQRTEDYEVSPRVWKKPKVEERKAPTKLSKAEHSKHPYTAETKTLSSVSSSTPGLVKDSPSPTPPSLPSGNRLKSRDPNKPLRRPNTGAHQTPSTKRQETVHDQSSKQATSSKLTGAEDPNARQHKKHPKQVTKSIVRTVEVIKTPDSTTSRVVKKFERPKASSFFNGAAQNHASTPPKESKPTRPLLPWEITGAPRGIYREYKY